jgi:MFS family permease
MRPVRATFFVFGSFWGTWAVVALDVQRDHGFSDAGLGLLLAATAFGGVAANAGGGVMTERFGTRRVLSSALVVWGALLVVLGSVHQTIPFCIAFLAAIAVGGLVDVAMNVAGTAALAHSPKGLMRLHALFNGGALFGAACAGILVQQGAEYQDAWFVIAVLSWGLALWCLRSDVPAGGGGEHNTVFEGLAAIRRDGLVLVAVTFMLGAVVEGGMATWGVLFLRSDLGLAAVAGAGAYVVGQAFATTARVTLGWPAEHLGERRSAQIGLTAAGIGLLVEAFVGVSAIAAMGLAIAAIGVAVYWPLLLAFAGRGRVRPGVVVGGLSAAGYVGFLAGPPIVGWIAQATSLQWGLVALAAAGLVGGSLRLSRAGESPADDSGRAVARFPTTPRHPPR